MRPQKREVESKPHLRRALRESQSGSEEGSRNEGPRSRSGGSHIKKVGAVPSHALQLGDGSKAAQLSIGQKDRCPQLELQQKKSGQSL